MLLTAIRPLSFLLICCCCMAGHLSAQLKIANVFSNDMVLQRDQPVRIWGTADNGTLITLQFAGQTKQCTAELNRK